MKTFKVWRMAELWYSIEVEAESEVDAIKEANDIIYEHGEESKWEKTEVFNVAELDDDGDYDGFNIYDGYELIED